MNPDVNNTGVSSFLDGGGETGMLIQNYPWSGTLLGPVRQWSPALRVTLGNMLHSAFPMFLFWGPDLTCFYNDAFRPSLGMDGKHPAIGKKGREVWPEIWNFIGPLIEKVIVTKEAVWFENQLVPFYRNGRIENIYWTFSYSPAYGDKGEVCGVLVTCMETTAAVESRKKIEDTVRERTEELQTAHASLLEANAYYQQVINLFQEPLQVLEPVIEGGEIIDFLFKITNEAYARYTGTTPDQLAGRRVGEVFPGYFQTTSFTNVVRAFLTGLSETWEIHYDKDGLDLYNRMSATKLGKEVVVHFTDNTHLKFLELQLLQKIEELQVSNKNLEQFAYAASHDLKEPIRKVHYFSERLKKELKDRLNPEQEKSFTRLEMAAARMDTLVNDLLTFSQMTVQPKSKEEISLNDMVASVLEDLEVRIHEKEARIEVANLPTVNGYRGQLQQLFHNLIANALKYHHPGKAPQVTLHCSEIKGSEVEHFINPEQKKQTYYQIRIVDNGIGFPPEEAERIFQVFQRLHGNHEYSGSGVGLSIARKAAENHDGYLYARSREGEGATFTLLLPVRS